MEVAIIDWKRIDSRFVKDEVYERINAPQWVDFDAPDDPVDDEAWFCRPECNHPKTIDDLRKITPSPKRPLQRSYSVSEISPLGERYRRDADLKKRGIVQPPVYKNKVSRWDKIGEGSENQNPNFRTPPTGSNKTNKLMKEAIKSSAEKKSVVEEGNLPKEKAPTLRRSLSAKNLFGGGDILTKISEFCNELKRLAIKAKERETEEEKPLQSSQGDQGRLDDGMTDVDIKEKEGTPLLEVSKENRAAPGRLILQEKQRRKLRYDDAEKTPISIDVKNTRSKHENSIRTNPPTPQCFSAGNAQPPKVFRAKLLPNNKEEEKEDFDASKTNYHNHDLGKQTSVVAEKEAKTLDVFWFLKPCTLSS